MADLFKPLGMQEISDFDGTRNAPSPKQRLENVRTASLKFRQKLMQQADVQYYQSIDLVRAPYPTWYGRMPSPPFLWTYIQATLSLSLYHFRFWTFLRHQGSACAPPKRWAGLPHLSRYDL